jgi:hypothetical protein
VSNGGKFKLYTVLNGLIFPPPTQPRISFERLIEDLDLCSSSCSLSNQPQRKIVTYLLQNTSGKVFYLQGLTGTSSVCFGCF